METNRLEEGEKESLGSNSSSNNNNNNREFASTTNSKATTTTTKATPSPGEKARALIQSIPEASRNWKTLPGGSFTSQPRVQDVVGGRDRALQWNEGNLHYHRAVCTNFELLVKELKFRSQEELSTNGSLKARTLRTELLQKYSACVVDAVMGQEGKEAPNGAVFLREVMADSANGHGWIVMTRDKANIKAHSAIRNLLLKTEHQAERMRENKLKRDYEQLMWTCPSGFQSTVANGVTMNDGENQSILGSNNNNNNKSKRRKSSSANSNNKLRRSKLVYEARAPPNVPSYLLQLISDLCNKRELNLRTCYTHPLRSFESTQERVMRRNLIQRYLAYNDGELKPVTISTKRGSDGRDLTEEEKVVASRTNRAILAKRKEYHNKILDLSRQILRCWGGNLVSKYEQPQQQQQQQQASSTATATPQSDTASAKPMVGTTNGSSREQVGVIPGLGVSCTASAGASSSHLPIVGEKKDNGKSESPSTVVTVETAMGANPNKKTKPKQNLTKTTGDKKLKPTAAVSVTNTNNNKVSLTETTPPHGFALRYLSTNAQQGQQKQQGGSIHLSGPSEFVPVNITQYVVQPYETPGQQVVAAAGKREGYNANTFRNSNNKSIDFSPVEVPPSHCTTNGGVVPTSDTERTILRVVQQHVPGAAAVPFYPGASTTTTTTAGSSAEELAIRSVIMNRAAAGAAAATPPTPSSSATSSAYSQFLLQDHIGMALKYKIATAAAIQEQQQRHYRDHAIAVAIQQLASSSSSSSSSSSIRASLPSSTDTMAGNMLPANSSNAVVTPNTGSMSALDTLATAAIAACNEHNDNSSKRFG